MLLQLPMISQSQIWSMKWNQVIILLHRENDHGFHEMHCVKCLVFFYPVESHPSFKICQCLCMHLLHPFLLMNKKLFKCTGVVVTHDTKYIKKQMCFIYIKAYY